MGTSCTSYKTTCTFGHIPEPTHSCGLPLHTLKPSKKSVSHTRSTVETGRLLANQVMNHSEQMDINSTFNRFNSSRASLGGWQWLEAGSAAWFHPMSVTWAHHSKHILEWPSNPKFSQILRISGCLLPKKNGKPSTKAHPRIGVPSLPCFALATLGHFTFMKVPRTCMSVRSSSIRSV